MKRINSKISPHKNGPLTVQYGSIYGPSGNLIEHPAVILDVAENPGDILTLLRCGSAESIRGIYDVMRERYLRAGLTEMAESLVTVSGNSLYLKDFLKNFSYNGESVSIVLEKKNIFDYEIFRYHNAETAIEKFGDCIVETWTISHDEVGMILKVSVKKGEI